MRPRKIFIVLLTILALAATMSILWLFKCRELSIFIDDRFGTTEIASIPVSSLTYQGSGTGGVLVINDLAFSLTLPDPDMASPHVGTSKDDQLALSFGGKVFPFGAPQAAAERGEESLVTSPAAGDDATMQIRRSAVCWIEPVKLQGGSPKQHAYYQLVWKKASGATLEMVWRYKRQYGPNIGWRDGFTSPEQSPSLIKIDIRL
jgi:hypothetical protein